MTDETGWQLDNDVRKIRLLTNARQLLNSPQIPEKLPTTTARYDLHM